MTKYFIPSLLLTFAIVLVLIQWTVNFDDLFNRSTQASPEATVLGFPETQNMLNVNFEGSEYKVMWFIVSDTDKLSLHQNFEERVPSSKFLEERECVALINGGFYSEDYQPLGLLISDNETINKEIESTLFDGIYSVNMFGTPRISRIKPIDKLRFAAQTGPILIENASVQSLIIKNDKRARRMVAAVTGKNTAVFIAVVGKSNFDGPYLNNLPEIINMFSEELDLGVADAINLDGGKASVFYTDSVELSEISMVGSFFCVK